MQIHTLNGHIQTLYIAAYPNKLLLLDGACRCDIPLIKTYITETLNRELSELKLVVVTHMHPDHAGAAHGLRKLTGCEIVSGNQSKQWYGGIGGGVMYWVDLMLANWLTRKLKKPRKLLFFNPYLKPDYKLNDGDTLPYFDDWIALETKGHTDRDLSLYHAESSTAYTADLIIKTQHGYISPFPVYLPDDYRHSLRKIQSLNITHLYLAHGGKTQLSHDEFEHFIAHKTPNSPRTFKSTLKYKLNMHR